MEAAIASCWVDLLFPLVQVFLFSHFVDKARSFGPRLVVGPLVVGSHSELLMNNGKHEKYLKIHSL